METDHRLMQLATISEACWWVRHYCRPRARDLELRGRAIARLAELALQELARPGDREATLYAIAAGLYERGDPRFI
jgi:hypothetical protein